MIKTYDKAIKRALDILYHKDNYCYFWGLKNQICTDSAMDWLIANESHFKNYGIDAIKMIKDFSRGKMGMDCSGFVSYCFGVNLSSSALIDSCVNLTTPKNGTEGNILWRPGHCGIDISNGFFLHFPIEAHTCEIGKISEYNWVKSGQLKGVDYTGASNV